MRPALKVERIVGAPKRPWPETETTLKGKLIQHLSQVLLHVLLQVLILCSGSYQCTE